MCKETIKDLCAQALAIFAVLLRVPGCYLSHNCVLKRKNGRILPHGGILLANVPVSGPDTSWLCLTIPRDYNQEKKEWGWTKDPPPSRAGSGSSDPAKKLRKKVGQVTCCRLAVICVALLLL
jgi:hypothetical protein